jgi:gluconolactonase
MFANPPVIEAQEIFRIPEIYRRKGRHHAVLEGPTFDSEGNLYFVNIWLGQILCLTPSGDFSVVFEYDGEPNGLAAHTDGRLFIADHKQGLLAFNPATSALETIIDRPHHERFKGLNDLTFSTSGDLFFTDQGESGLQDPTGRLWKLDAKGNLRLVLDCIPSPNGLVPALDERILYLAVTRANAIWRVPMYRDGTPSRVGVFIQMSGGIGPDGMALDELGGLAVAHAGLGVVWLFNDVGRPMLEIRTGSEKVTTNVAFGRSDRRTLYITTGERIFTALLETAGKRLFA